MVDHYKQDSHQIMSSERICHHLFANIFRLEMCLNCIKPMLAGVKHMECKSVLRFLPPN